jgi:hypothetical protein
LHIEPPIGDARQLARLFTRRRGELSRAILPLFNGRNLLVRAMLGVGKSAFILRLLHELDAQAKAARDKLLPIYIYHFYGGATEDFYRLVVLALAQLLSDKDEEAQAILEGLQGWEITSNPFDFLDLFVERASKRFRRLVIAVNDLDKS